MRILVYFTLQVFILKHSLVVWSLYDSPVKTCPEEKSTLNGIFTWKINDKNSMNYVISHPDICWDNNSIVLRQCDFKSGQWIPKEVQCEQFGNRNMKCPDDLIELYVKGDYICLKISTKEQPFNEQFCYGANYILGYNQDVTDDEILKILLNKYKIMSFWMPMKRYEENDFNPFVIRLPGKQWNELYANSGNLLLEGEQTLSDKHCVVAYIKQDVEGKNEAKLQMKVIHCNEHLYSVCVLKKHFVAKSGCPQDFGALSYRPNECYGITWEGQKYPDDFRILKVTEYFKKLNTLKIIFEEFNIVNNKYVEIEGTSQIINGKWAIKPENNRMKIVSSFEKIHGLCVEHIQSRKNVEMILRLDSDMKSLILTVYNKYYIWSNDKPENSIHCFTNADYKELSKVEIKKIWENESNTKTIFKLKIKSNDPGQYWCEAHTIFNFTHVSSKKVLAAKTKTGHIFSMYIEYNLTDCLHPNTFIHEHMKHTAMCIKNAIKSINKNHKRLDDLIIHNVRIMDILYISPNASYLRCVCHTTVSLKSSMVDTSKEQGSEEDISLEYDKGFSHDIIVEMKARELLISLMMEFQPRFFKSVRSTEFCFPENDWLLARIGQSATKREFCLQKNGLPITRRCVGDFIIGAYWEKDTSNMTYNECIIDIKQNLITKNLYALEVSKVSKEQPEKAVKNARTLLESNIKNLIPADLYYLAKIIQNAIRTILKHAYILTTDLSHNNYIQRTWYAYNFSETTIEIVRIFNNLLEINEQVIRPSVVFNSTNILLDSFEYLIDQMSSLDAFRVNTLQEPFNININSHINTSVSLENPIKDNDKGIDIIDYVDIGVIVKIATNFVVFVINPQVANVTGMSLFRSEVKSSPEFRGEGLLRGAFENEYYRFILANQSVGELLNEKNILLGTFVPTSLWQRLDEISMMSNMTAQTQRPEPKIVIKIYANDKLFQETENTSSKIASERIISISIPGHDKDLPEVLPIILTAAKIKDSDNYKNESHQHCTYWNFQTWANDGVTLLARSVLNNNTVLCGCTHLTPFAYLIGGSYNLSVDSEIEVVVKRIHEQALDIITLLGCSLSLFGIAGIFVTAFTFRSWRQKANSKVLLQLSAAIALQMILFCFINTEENANHLIKNGIFTSCIAIGACLHYSVLVQFCWMIIIAYLQFKRYVQVFGNTRPKRFLIKSTILGWGLPLIPVACLLIFDSASYIPHQNELANPICYPSGVSLYITIVLPITFVIFANLIIFVVIIYNILKNPAGAIRHTEKSLALSQIRLLVLLFFLLGFTWIFGLLTTMKAGLVFSYLFCITATLQGFILFVYFIVMDPLTRRMWHTYLHKLCGSQRNLDNFSSIKETTQSF